MCNQLLAAYEAEEKPQVAFTISNIMTMHRCAIGWWRAAMEAYTRKLPMLEANFGVKISCGPASTHRLKGPCCT